MCVWLCVCSEICSKKTYSHAPRKSSSWYIICRCQTHRKQEQVTWKGKSVIKGNYPRSSDLSHHLPSPPPSLCTILAPLPLPYHQPTNNTHPNPQKPIPSHPQYRLYMDLHYIVRYHVTLFVVIFEFKQHPCVHVLAHGGVAGQRHQSVLLYSLSSKLPWGPIGAES